ncbi:geraniol 8-hydroxylase-like isoform X2 [Gossypium raimondii]|uniref:geraniol 8-hydroxylase-like isoform X2 n=1 Tax=Gossypium raimondii TaxID=29730 RepID=UPI00227BAB62|nr:geraniol 8-hydroxylase-like isoform X2 [Gossypium raimondii]
MTSADSASGEPVSVVFAGNLVTNAFPRHEVVKLDDGTYLQWHKQDLFTAGTDTTTSTLEWAMAELLHNPKALQEVRRELQQIIGEGNVVEESNVTRLPYLQDCILHFLSYSLEKLK